MAAQAALNREGLAVCPECFMVSLATAVPRGGMCGACNAGATEPEVWSVASSSPSRSSVPGSPAARRPPASAELAAAQSPETPAPRLPVPDPAFARAVDALPPRRVDFAAFLEA
eukprot:CAMPEP_0118856044 /NCGR_PEP_ID=MMETSP1163-20130328/3646_1 /TAXON_ID=124430 /ORGANISM="Phaeomonas parva, Strain CCMP2877" /LENGTH=113 /DNA_ID=CAMNT_0006789067 /DNA_START=334 /DNA_END=671 /DNA_ORIENTATION=-